MMITTARLRADGAASKKHFQSFHFLQCVLLAVSGAGGTILKSSTFLHERVRRANADMSKNISTKSYKYASPQWLI